MVPQLRLPLILFTGIAGLSWAAGSEPADRLPPTPLRLTCQAFPVSMGSAIDTRDRGSDLGRWVIDLEARGWQVHSVDFEMGQKPTGYAQGFAQVCLTPVVSP